MCSGWGTLAHSSMLPLLKVDFIVVLDELLKDVDEEEVHDEYDLK